MHIIQHNPLLCIGILQVNQQTANAPYQIAKFNNNRITNLKAKCSKPSPKAKIKKIQKQKNTIPVQILNQYKKPKSFVSVLPYGDINFSIDNNLTTIGNTLTFPNAASIPLMI